MIGRKKRIAPQGTTVMVGRTMSRAEHVVLNGDRSIRKALELAGISKKDSEIIQVNGEEIDDLDHELEEGDKVLLIKNVQGGAF